MRSLVRTRTLTALCALLLVFASIAHAGVPGRPIDRPGGPPDPDPTMVGDPDDGQGHIVIIVTPWRAFSLRLSWMRPAYLSPSRAASGVSPIRSKKSWGARGGHAR